MCGCLRKLKWMRNAGIWAICFNNNNRRKDDRQHIFSTCRFPFFLCIILCLCRSSSYFHLHSWRWIAGSTKITCFVFVTMMSGKAVKGWKLLIHSWECEVDKCLGDIWDTHAHRKLKQSLRSVPLLFRKEKVRVEGLQALFFWQNMPTVDVFIYGIEIWTRMCECGQAKFKRKLYRIIPSRLAAITIIFIFHYGNPSVFTQCPECFLK